MLAARAIRWTTSAVRRLGITAAETPTMWPTTFAGRCTTGSSSSTMWKRISMPRFATTACRVATSPAISISRTAAALRSACRRPTHPATGAATTSGDGMTTITTMTITTARRACSTLTLPVLQQRPARRKSSVPQPSSSNCEINAKNG